MTLLECIHTLILGPLELLFDVIYALAYRFAKNPGLAVVALSLAVNILVLPLYRRADVLQDEERARSQRMKPRIDQIREAFSGDERFMMLQTYYRQNNYKPYHALKGSLSLLLEIPFFIAAYNYLSGLSLLRGASFGPIADLGAPDTLLHIGGTVIHLLPILMTAINIVSGAIYTRGMPARSKIQLYGMALIFLVLLYESPSGLVLYWTLNNLFSLGKNICQAVFAKLKKKREPKAGNRAGKPGETKTTRTIFVACCVLLAVLTGVLIPSAIIADSPAEFVELSDFHSPLLYVLKSALLAVGTFLIWIMIYYRLSEKRTRRVFSFVTAFAALAATVNYMFFGKGYGNISSLLIYDIPIEISGTEMLWNLAAILATGVLVWFIGKVKKGELLKAVCIAGCLALTAMSAINLFAIHSATSDLEKVSKNRAEMTPEFTLSRNGKNVVVIMLDRAIGGFVPYLFEENPALKEQYAGFTWYPNTFSFGPHTNSGSPPLYGGYEYTPEEMNRRSEESLKDKHNEALKVMPVLFSENGWQATVCDPPFANYQYVPDLRIFDGYENIRAYNAAEAYENEQVSPEQKDATRKRNLFMYSVFRISPVAAHLTVYDKGRYNEAAEIDPDNIYVNYHTLSLTESYGIRDDFLKNYTALRHLPDMTKIGDSGENTFLSFSNGTTHEFMLLQEPAFEPAYHTDNAAYEAEHGVRTAPGYRDLIMDTAEQMEHYQVNMAALTLLGKWFDLLREEGVWDNTRIIIVSDHGQNVGLSWILTDDGSTKDGLGIYDVMSFNPLLMIKDFGSTAFTTDDTFMTNADVPSEAFRGLIDHPVNPFTGKPIDDAAKEQNELTAVITDSSITKNAGNTFSDPKWVSLKNRYLFNPENWTGP